MRVGSIVLSAGLGYEWPSRVGGMLAVAGIGIALWSALLQRSTNRRQSSQAARTGAPAATS